MLSLGQQYTTSEHDQQLLTLGIYNTLIHTIVKLTVEFFTVDDIEPVLDPCSGIGHSKIEPLMMMIAVDIRIQQQVIFILANL